MVLIMKGGGGWVYGASEEQGMLSGGGLIVTLNAGVYGGNS